MDPVFIRMRRNNSGHPWGFSIQGGIDQGDCLYIHKVAARGIAERAGLQPGDGIIRISNTYTDGLKHEQAKMEIIRAGNELDFLVQRNVKNVPKTPPHPNGPYSNTVVSDESTEYRGYCTSNAQSRSFRILQESLDYTEADAIGK